MPFSLWKDNTEKSMEEIIGNILNYPQWHTSEIDEFDGSVLRFVLNRRFTEDRNIHIGETEINFNVIEFEQEKVRPREKNNEIRPTRIQTITGFVIIFTDGVTTKYILNKSYIPQSLTILRKINNYSGQLKISEEKFSIVPDFFFWVVNKVIDSPGAQLGDDQNMGIQLVTGFKGETDDKLAEIVGSGDRIINLISTLTFLLETENLSRVEMLLMHERETYGIKLGINSYIDIELEKYTGEYIFHPEEIASPHILLKVFLIVIPDLFAVYDQEMENQEWNDDIKRAFLNSIGATIQDRIEEKLGLSEV